MQFYRVELAEQRRLMGVMEHHSRECFVVSGGEGGSVGVGGDGEGVGRGAAGGGGMTGGAGLNGFMGGVKGLMGGNGLHGPATATGSTPATVNGNGTGNGIGGASLEGKDYAQSHSQARSHTARAGFHPPADETEFPFSITAGIEKGALNRYRNIWPFAHTRVRLPKGTASDGSDYVNASFVHPRGTRRRYVCAQGPLEATRGDFWNLVWDQNITTIIMLTKQTEAGLSKCCPYWSQPLAGPFKLKLLSAQGGEDEPGTGVGGGGGGGFFDMHGTTDEQGPIKRVFALSKHGSQGERIVTQLQMVSWPDWEVPHSPRTLLGLIEQTNQLRARAKDPDAPVLVHCSAGVGRTGSFVLIDAVLDGLRSELLERKARLDRGDKLSLHRNGNGKAEGMGMGLGLGSAVAPPSASASGGTNGSASASGSFSSLSLSFRLHRQSSMDSSAPTSRSPSTDISLPPSPGPAHAAAAATAAAAAAAAAKLSPSESIVTLLPSHSPLSLTSNPNPESFHHSFDYTLPRSKHARAHPSRTPTPLSSMHPDPIQQVLEDMREQRMSLCQSLTQYVFCHRAICEGAIGIAREVFGEDWPGDLDAHADVDGPTPASPSILSPNAMELDSPEFNFSHAHTPMALANPNLHMHAKRAASKSPEQVERLLSLSPGMDVSLSPSGSPCPAAPAMLQNGVPTPTPGMGLVHESMMSRKPSVKRQMTRRGDVACGAASPMSMR
ncbi:hypothetical protein DACRYDRAFT_96213 [Dacryopinax primogenitus]|uniref:Phosphatases II n=1 Tax=Dacryopinax primogenitus (strain DJM 731) TaxID=1858805 RepID=M5G536_DACPD|nr:uncharacterized protein DACRYDRAFT_96213 [Dacryopinax primogenitus]EJT98867.1 hypothetical protein DACRYDRAFT_96213 [Dacryopinax primogenitus]